MEAFALDYAEVRDVDDQIRKFSKVLLLLKTASFFTQSNVLPTCRKYFRFLEPYFTQEVFRERVENELNKFRLATLPEGYDPGSKKVVRQKKEGRLGKFLLSKFFGIFIRSPRSSLIKFFSSL